MTLGNIRFRTLLRPLLIVPVVGTLYISCTSNPSNRPSPLRKDSVKIGESIVKITYSSPGIKGRKIFGAGNDYLEPYGKIWRTGANDATFITTDKKIAINSFVLTEGRYSIFTIPHEKEWTVIFNKEWDQWGSYGYDAEKDLFRVSVSPKKLKKPVERMELFFKDDSLKFNWEYTSWAIPLSPLP